MKRIGHWLGKTGLAVLLALLASACLALAQAPATPVQLSDEQVNQIVKAVTGAVLNDLKASAQAPAPAAPAPPPAPGSDAASAEEFAEYLQQKQLAFFEQFNATLRAYPALADHVGSIIERVDGGPTGRSTLAFLGFVAAIIAAGVALAYGATAAARRLLPGTEPKSGPASIAQTLRRAAANLIGLALFWMVTAYCSAKFFHGLGMQGTVGQWMLMGAGHFALYYTVLLIWFRPAEPEYRIVPLEGADTKPTMRLFVTVMAVVVLRSWIAIPIANHQPAPVIAAGLLINNLMFVSSFFAAALPARDAMRRWIETTAVGVQASPLRRWFAANWLVLAGTGVLTISAVHAYGAVTNHVSVVAGLTSTVQAVVAMVLVCALVEFVGRRSERAEQASRRAVPRLPSLVSRMLRVLILLSAAVYFIRLWAVDALQVMTPAQWGKLADFAIEPLAAVFAGYLAVSYVNYYAVRYLATHPVTVTSINENGDLVSKADGSSRLRTLIPIIRVTANVLIVIMIALLVLSQLGFNITPLLAGASVIGLAISFGSQTLVKDIVTGVLFLAEDAFRIGEYIVCGNSSGTVEGFTLRSVRLRHADGQIFTVPFGQIGEIVNFSRDWATVNFNMSLDRDADLDDIRRVTAQVADSLKADFRSRLLDPLKVQGVKDVTDTAIVVQFKFTALPHDPGEIERVARSRLLKAFRDNGIALSRPTWFSAGTAAQPA
ncbi:mechanosensitive ion channel family protein [Aestuariivirga sp.]|uniref:mechanosensitive ion channel family protein n=1 Tax=Aestuariivirga sp. TaxID=2650926 RepID=UPI0025C2A9B4|nr:mechanosensitive ion channel family protein [Aestuariivirga sp.]MCA3555418.1 mechanosensitive ion channel family protein [Aestuariivirga sp.]